MKRAKCNFYTKFVNDNSRNQKKLFAATKQLLLPRKELYFPNYHDMDLLTNELGQYFTKKIGTIRSQLNFDNIDPDGPPLYPVTSSQFLSFEPLSEDDVRKLISELGKKSCLLDPMLTPIMLECLDVLLPVITTVINLSLESSQFPDICKEAIGYPLLKKAGLDTGFSNLHLISNLSFISKLTERAVFKQLNDHMLLNDLYPILQSAYRRYHSTEPALLKVTNDILLDMNSQCVSLLVLLDLSAAFDTIDHTILLKCLQTNLGIGGTAVMVCFLS